MSDTLTQHHNYCNSLLKTNTKHEFHEMIKNHPKNTKDVKYYTLLLFNNYKFNNESSVENLCSEIFDNDNIYLDEKIKITCGYLLDLCINHNDNNMANFLCHFFDVKMPNNALILYCKHGNVTEVSNILSNIDTVYPCVRGTLQYSSYTHYYVENYDEYYLDGFKTACKYRKLDIASLFFDIFYRVRDKYGNEDEINDELYKICALAIFDSYEEPYDSESSFSDDYCSENKIDNDKIQFMECVINFFNLDIYQVLKLINIGEPSDEYKNTERIKSKLQNYDHDFVCEENMIKELIIKKHDLIYNLVKNDKNDEDKMHNYLCDYMKFIHDQFDIKNNKLIKYVNEQLNEQ